MEQGQFLHYNSYIKGKKRIKGEDKAHIIIFIPTGNPNVKEAVDKAIESMPGCVALLDGVIDYKWFYIPYIYGQSAYIVEGTPLIDPSGSRASADMPEQYIVTRLDEEGNIMSTRAVDQAEFEEIKSDILVN